MVLVLPLANKSYLISDSHISLLACGTASDSRVQKFDSLWKMVI
jgi:hypothetical protein